jgi:hypothetical protein
VDYRKFLAKVETRVLPYFGGTRVDDRARRLRLTGALEAPGWYEFLVKGRDATVKGPADAPDPMMDLPLSRGHVVGEWLVGENASCEPMMLMPEDEPDLLAPARARRWPSGDLIFEAIDFEGDAEGAARDALADARSLEGIKGVSSALRAAFAYATLKKVSRDIAIPFGAREVRKDVRAVSERGPAAAVEALRRLDEERRLWRALHPEEPAPTAHHPPPRKYHGPEPTLANAEERAEAALEAAGARMMSVRRMHGNQIEVTYRFMEERFITICDALTLNVWDSGICLGHGAARGDRELTLESLPAVIREAIESERLVITRR